MRAGSSRTSHMHSPCTADLLLQPAAQVCGRLAAGLWNLASRARVTARRPARDPSAPRRHRRRWRTTARSLSDGRACCGERSKPLPTTMVRGSRGASSASSAANSLSSSSAIAPLAATHTVWASACVSRSANASSTRTRRPVRTADCASARPVMATMRISCGIATSLSQGRLSNARVTFRPQKLRAPSRTHAGSRGTAPSRR